MAHQLFSLARAVYEDLYLTSLVRLDIRADDGGRLHILEANPKPDLARPKASASPGAVTSMVAAGLPALGWSYDDLIACLLVERLWQLRTTRPEAVAHIFPDGTDPDDLIAALPHRIACVLESRAHLHKLRSHSASAARTADLKRHEAMGTIRPGSVAPGLAGTLTLMRSQSHKLTGAIGISMSGNYVSICLQPCTHAHSAELPLDCLRRTEATHVS